MSALQLRYACLATTVHLPCDYGTPAMQLRCFRFTSSHSLLAESDNSYLPVGYYRSCQTSCSISTLSYHKTGPKQLVHLIVQALRVTTCIDD